MSATATVRRGRRLVRTLLTVAVAGLGLGWPGTAQAAATAPFGSAFVWADQPTADNYPPNSLYQWNSAHHNSTDANTITRTGTGRYTVHLPDLGATSGTVLVTGYGASSDYCKVARWGPTRTTQDVEVRCFDAAAVPTDTPFTMSYANPQLSGGEMGYVWANEPTSDNYVPALPRCPARREGVPVPA
jgi:hypothetical protein